MKKDLPNIYKGQIPSSVRNNKDVYYTSEKETEKKVNVNMYSDQPGTVEEKLKKLFRGTRYVFNIGVIIETDRKTYDTKIAGQVKNSIVTVDGDVIPIIEIKNIIIKDRL